jgi:ABC-type cobalamin transport system permease subunit
MTDTTDELHGFAHPGHIARFQRRRTAVLAQLVATIALAVATAIAATVVSIEIAQAGVLKVAPGAGGGLMVALTLTLVTVGTSGLAVLAAVAPIRCKW